MLDDFIEFILELILEGAIEAAGSRRVPMPIRILLAGIILLLGLGVIGLLFWCGIDSGSTALVVLAAVLLLVFVGLIISSVRRHKHGKTK